MGKAFQCNHDDYCDGNDDDDDDAKQELYSQFTKEKTKFLAVKWNKLKLEKLHNIVECTPSELRK